MAPGSRLSGERPGPWWASLPKEEEQASASGGRSTPSGEGTLAMRRGAELGGEGPVTFTTLSSLRLGSLGAAGRGRRWGRHARGWEQVAGRRGGAEGLGGTVWAPAGAANGSPPPPSWGGAQTLREDCQRSPDKGKKPKRRPRGWCLKPGMRTHSVGSGRKAEEVTRKAERMVAGVGRRRRRATRTN